MRILSLLFLFFVGLFSTPLSAQKKPTKPENDILSEEYYKQMSSNIERLHKLRLGVFVQYNKDTTGALNAWKFNYDEDSVLLYTVEVGNVAKDGYWVYHHQFISNMPDMPLYTALENIVPVSRDSFVGYFYECPIKPTIEALHSKKSPFNELDLKGLKRMEEEVYYVKVDFTEFHGFSVPYNANPAQDEARYGVDFYKITKDHIRFFNVTAKKDSPLSVILDYQNKMPDERYRTYLVRFYPETIPLFSENSKKKGK